MQDEIKTYLYDILSAIGEIESFFSDGSKKMDEYRKELQTQRAVERNIEIIGKAINRIMKQDNSIVIKNDNNITLSRLNNLERMTS